MNSRMQLCLSGWILVLLLVSCQAEQVSILVDGRAQKIRHRSLRAVSSLGGTHDSCSDAVEISDPSGVHFPRRYRNLTRPWMRKDLKARLYRSEVLDYNWWWMRSLRVRGLAATTVYDVISKLESQGCLFVGWGGAVRDAILGRNPTDIDGEVTCTAEMVREVCIKTFGSVNCGGPLRNNFTRTVIGNTKYPMRRNELTADPMDVSEWNATFATPPSQWEFTANSIGLYDDQKGNVYLLDLTGQGVRDVCAHRIDMSVDEARWDEWADGDLIKLLRYYKLRLHGFIPASSNVKRFIVNRAQLYYSVKKMQHFYCQYVMDGSFMWRGKRAREAEGDNDQFTSTCLVAPIDTHTRGDMHAVEKLLKADFGDFYDDEIRYAISTMELRVLAHDKQDDSAEGVTTIPVEKETSRETADEEEGRAKTGEEGGEKERGEGDLLAEKAKIVEVSDEKGALEGIEPTVASTESTRSSDHIDEDSEWQSSPEVRIRPAETSLEDMSHSPVEPKSADALPTDNTESVLEKDTRELSFRVVSEDASLSEDGATERVAVEARTDLDGGETQEGTTSTATRHSAAVLVHMLLMACCVFLL